MPLLPLLGALLLCLLLAACGKKNDGAGAGQVPQETAAAETQAPQFQNGEEDVGHSLEDVLDEDAARDAESDEVGDEDGAEEDYGEGAGDEDSRGEDAGQGAASDNGSDSGAGIFENGVYTTAEDVALYLHTYGKLPLNFMTKKEARAKGWSGGSLEEYAPGMCIGGDRFGNYEGVLPD